MTAVMESPFRECDLGYDHAGNRSDQPMPAHAFDLSEYRNGFRPGGLCGVHCHLGQVALFVQNFRSVREGWGELEDPHILEYLVILSSHLSEYGHRSICQRWCWDQVVDLVSQSYSGPMRSVP